MSSWPPMIKIGTLMASFLLAANAARSPVPRQGSTISWSPCPDNDSTQCAFLDVPRDYANQVEGDTVSIFMRKYPANVSDENRLGSILVNPGGPGGSGSGTVASDGEYFSTIVQGKYDIIGFDPRGVNLTGPWTACFDVEAKPLLLDYQETNQGVPYPHSSLDNDRAVVKRLRAIQAGSNAACVEKGNKKILESVGTAFVVQDMAQIVEALGEDGLNYLGFSYGTILGATFAAMRPDLVNRMVLDGVSNAESYFNDVWQWGRDGMAETYKTYNGFLSTCIEAGPQYCALAKPPGNSSTTQTVESLRRRINAIFARLDSQPAVIADSSVGPGVFTASNLQKLLLGLLYNPSLWSYSMQALALIEQGGDISIVYDLLYSPYSYFDRQPYNENVFNRSMQRYATRESIRPILCGDAAATNISVNAYTEYFRELGKLSPVGEQWANIVGACSGWSFRASQRYTGPWTTAKGLNKTRFPILFMSSDADPVTPLSSAVKMSRGFGNESATLLIQKGFGHCTTAHPSLCTYKHLRDYFVDGKVPANGTYCVSDPGFIYPTNSTNTKRATLTRSDSDLLDAAEKISKSRARRSNGGIWGI
ncbi:alpha/beta hydrolase family protein [Ceratobasidium sp. AG-Ba]|nr:alpha/beta hydrolase family protein [Ceratobasidium sp. AG-Ba]